MANVVKTLGKRGLISQSSESDLAERFEGNCAVIYAGFDPTAPSLHVGNLLQIMLLAQFQRHGHRPIALIGGATAMIGDPSGKSQERNLLDQETIAHNIESIRGQLSHYLDFDCGPNSALLVNNADWIGEFGFVSFLRDVGKHFRVGEMMGKESVRKRLNSTAGMSFTEFSYQILQAYDFLHLYREHGCICQTGGDDQWGNITAGIELVRKLAGKSVCGLTSPLITTASGQKFGKTESGAIYLNPSMSSPYEFYQYWLRCDDGDVIRLLRFFTFLPDEQIAELEEQVRTEPHKRTAQLTLAGEVTTMTHGPEQTAAAIKASEVLFGKEIAGLSDRDLISIFADVPSSIISPEQLDSGLDLLDALCRCGLCDSRGAAKKLVKSGGVYVNNVRVDRIEHKLTSESLASESIIVFRTGKKNYHLLKSQTG